MTENELQLADAALNRARWRAILRRDGSRTPSFFYCVVTTGVYCRPGCRARTPLRRNVVFVATAREAERAGFRPCQRCRPERPAGESPHAAEIERACRWLEQEPNCSLAQLSEHVGLSPFHLHRVFKASTGLTPRQYASAERAERMRRALATANSVTEAVYEAGYNSASSFYAEANQVLGMAPSAYRRGASARPLRYTIQACTLGWVLVAASEQGVCAISLGSEPQALLAEFEQRFGASQLSPDDPQFATWVARAVALIDGARHVELPLDIRGTVFQQRVWQLLSQIPFGETRTYSELSQALGDPNATRAVASACAQNPLAVAVPCHRVVRRDGKLAGYRWGLELKDELLRRERDG